MQCVVGMLDLHHILCIIYIYIYIYIRTSIYQNPLFVFVLLRTPQVTNYSMQRRSPHTRRWWMSKRLVTFALLTMLIPCYSLVNIQCTVITSLCVCVCLSVCV